MGVTSVLAAAAASWIFGAVWYGIVSKAWIEAADVPLSPSGRPVNATKPAPYIISALSAVIVAGMMRHVFNLAGIDTVGEGLVGGLGIGLFLATPWIATNYAFAGKPAMLTLIDGAYATVGCMLMGLVLTLL